MKNTVRRNIYFLIAIPLLLVLLLCEFVLFKESSPRDESIRIFKVFDQKEKRLIELIGLVDQYLTTHPEAITDWTPLQFFEQENEGLAVTVSKDNTLLFWSSSTIAFPSGDSHFKKPQGLIHIPTGWYYQLSRKSGIYTIQGFILIKREFPYRNRFIKSYFDKDFKLADEYQVNASPDPEAFNIRRPDGSLIFSVSTDHSGVPQSRSDLSALLYFALVLMLLTQLNVWLKFSRHLSPGVKFSISLAIPLLIYLVGNRFRIPNTLYQTNLFSPRDFAFSGWLSSLGEFMLLTILMFHTAQTFLLLSDLKGIAKARKIGQFFSFLFAGFYFTFSVALLKILLLNSGISLEFFSNLKFSAINLYAFFAVLLHVIGFILIVLRLRSDYYAEMGFGRFILAFSASALLSALIVLSLGFSLNLTPYIYYAVVVLIIARLEIEKIKEYRYTFLLMMAIAGASYVNLYSQELIVGKKNKVLDLWAVKLSAERDPGAEIFLSELDNKLRKDTIIQYYLSPPYKLLETYFRNNYFTGFWRNYDMQITVCSPEDNVILTDDKMHYPCFEFFDNLKNTKGMLVSGSNFYFMDRVNSRICYLGQLDFVNVLNIPVKVFIELNSKAIPEGKGYPELLLDQHASRESQVGDISYAKYFDGKLVDRGGDYQYSMTLPATVSVNMEFTYFSKNGFRHCVYNRNNNNSNIVVVSYPEKPFYERISTFPYLFLLFYLIGATVLIFYGMNFRLRPRKLDFREKIQLTLILSLLGILTIIGLGLMIYNSNKLLNSLQDNLNEKLRSVSNELSMRIGQETELNAPMRDFLNEQLIVLSDIIWADINLYDLNGRLFSTSRSEIYDRGLLSRRINPAAFRALSVENKTLFLHKEKLGELNFYSAYSPVYNQNNDLIGYLNLPYFARQNELKKQVSDFIVAFSNLYILLIMFSLIVAMMISHKLTAPLLQIENNLKGIQLGKPNARIDYSGEDEIGRLAREYNKKVDELAVSADLLARSERESAWQEMARQVAHEINNPLTPMKLSIQYLQRIKEKDPDNFDSYFKRVSRTLVEQIDALSLIASSFSDFASMPTIREEMIDLAEKIWEVVFLFENIQNVSVSFENRENQPVQVVADKIQLGRAMINLIKNGTQAIPRDRQGILKVELYKDDSSAYITVTDNGIGIPAGLQDKLFDPNFTTKSSGMGLGLAITKRIIENFNGEIWFESGNDMGTTFFIKLPLANPV